MTEETLDERRNELFRRIGRNLWMYQQVEGQLKGLLTVSGFSANGLGVQAGFEARLASVSKRSMGQLVHEATGSVLAREAPPPTNYAVDWLTFSARWDAGTDFADDLHQKLAVLVADRNELAHHALSRWPIDSLDGMAVGLDQLNVQRERIIEVSNILTRIGTHLVKAAQAMADFMGTSEFAEQLRRHRLDACLQDVVARAARADGWTLLSQAGHLFGEHRQRLSAEQTKALPGLSRLLIDSGLFEMRDEPTKGGGSRSLCRLRRQKPDG